jgi:hypothetical protein
MSVKRFLESFKRAICSPYVDLEQLDHQSKRVLRNSELLQDEK